MVIFCSSVIRQISSNAALIHVIAYSRPNITVVEARFALLSEKSPYLVIPC